MEILQIIDCVHGCHLFRHFLESYQESGRTHKPDEEEYSSKSCALECFQLVFGDYLLLESSLWSQSPQWD